jgi:hypothetical protein
MQEPGAETGTCPGPFPNISVARRSQPAALVRFMVRLVQRGGARSAGLGGLELGPAVVADRRVVGAVDQDHLDLFRADL